MTTVAPSTERNISLLYLLRGTRNFLLVMPILVLFFEENGLSLQQIFILQSCFSLTSLILEIPTGYFSDQVGRRAALLIGSVATVIGFMFYASAHGFWTFFVSELFLGIGTSFVSGSDTAYLHENIQVSLRPNRLGASTGKLVAMGSLAEGAASIVGGALAARSLRAPFFAQIAIAGISLIVSLLLKSEVRRSRFEMPVRKPTLVQAVSGTLKRGSGVGPLIFGSAAFHVTTLSVIWLLQPYLKSRGISLHWLGLTWAMFQFAFGLSALSAFRIAARWGSLKIIQALLFALGGTCFLMAAQLTGPLTFLLPVVFFITRGLAIPTLTSMISAKAGGSSRATALSLQSLANRLSFAMVGPALGWAGDHFSLTETFGGLGLICFLAALVFVWVTKAGARAR